MNRTSVKHRAFTIEPMRDKGITSVPGIGSAYSAKLSEAGFSKNNAGTVLTPMRVVAFQSFSSWEYQYSPLTEVGATHIVFPLICSAR
ncbi:barrier to autointegration factor [Cooperia oncophora]